MPEDTDAIRACVVKVSLMTRTGMDYLFELPIDELMKIVKAMKKP